MSKDHSLSLLRVQSMIAIVAYHCVCFYGIWDELFPDAFRYEHIESFRFICILALQMFTFISGYLYAQGQQSSLFVLLKKKRLGC